MRKPLIGLAGPAGLLLLAACGGSDAGTEPTRPIVVAVSPAKDTLTTGTGTAFHASVTGTQNGTVVWSLPDGVSAGTISTAGFFTAGSTPGTYRILATSTQTSQSADTALAQVVAAPSAALTAPDTALAGSGGVAVAAPIQPGMIYLWSVTGGSISAGQGTSTVRLTAGPVGMMIVYCTVTNLADSAVTGADTVHVKPVPPPPAITSWTASPPAVTSGQGLALTAVFSNGTGVVDQGIGTVSSGVPVVVGALSDPTTFQLTVTGFGGQTAVAQTTVAAFPAPKIYYFDPVGRVAPIGGKGLLAFLYEHYPDAAASIDHGIGPVIGEDLLTTVLGGTTLFTATVRNGADSAIVDTATITAVAPAPGTFSLTGALNRPRAGHVAVPLLDGRVLVLGGSDVTGQVPPTELYDPGSGNFSISGLPPWSPEEQSVVRLSDGSVLILGGSSDRGAAVYTPATGLFSARADMLESHIHAAAALLADGRVLVAGGVLQDWHAEIFDPVANTWSPTGPLAIQIGASKLITLLDGRVLVLTDGHTEAQLYDPAAGTFSVTGSMASIHTGGSVTRLQDGRVLVAGGSPNGINVNSTAEVYTPGAGTFSRVGDLALGRYGHTATLRPDGTVLIIRGFRTTLNLLPYGEIFNPGTGVFTPTVANSALPRLGGIPAPLQDGRVLITGGIAPLPVFPPYSYLPQAEIFQ